MNADYEWQKVCTLANGDDLYVAHMPLGRAYVVNPNAGVRVIWQTWMEDAPTLLAALAHEAGIGFTDKLFEEECEREEYLNECPR